MSTYEEVVKDRQRIKRAVQLRTMPPWGADNTGLCGTWEDARWLTNDEIATIVSWVEAAKLRPLLGRDIILLSDPDRRVPPFCNQLSHCQVLLDPNGVVRWGAFDENWRSIRTELIVQAAYRLR